MSRSKNCCLFPALGAWNANSVAISLCTMQRSLFLFQFFLMICSLNYLADVHLFSANLFFLPDAAEVLQIFRTWMEARNRSCWKSMFPKGLDGTLQRQIDVSVNCTCDQRTDVTTTRCFSSFFPLFFSPDSQVSQSGKQNHHRSLSHYYYHHFFLAVLGAPKESRTSRSIISVSPVNLHVYSKTTCESCFESIIYKMSILPISEWCLLDPFKAKCHFVSGNFSKQLWGMTPSSPPPTSYTQTHTDSHYTHSAGGIMRSSCNPPDIQSCDF